MNYELEAHSHGGVDERKMEMDRNEGNGRNLEGEKWKKCWLVT